MPTAQAIGIALAAAHVALVAFVAWLVLRSRDPDWPMLWGLLIVIDFPGSLAVAAIGTLIGKVSVPRAPIHRVLDLHNFVLPLVLLGIGGTVWWYALPQVIAWVFNATAVAAGAA